MTDKKFNFVVGFIVGGVSALLLVFLISWIYEYGVNLPLYQKTGIVCLFGGMMIMYCLMKIDWSVGF